MKLRALAAAAAMVLIATPALASRCPRDMAAIDAALASNPQLGASQLAEVKELRARGEKEHEAGNHQASVEALARAREILGIR